MQNKSLKHKPTRNGIASCIQNFLIDFGSFLAESALIGSSFFVPGNLETWKLADKLRKRHKLENSISMSKWWLKQFYVFASSHKFAQAERWAECVCRWFLFSLQLRFFGNRKGFSLFRMNLLCWLFLELSYSHDLDN